MPRSKKQAAQETYDLLVAGGTVLDEIFAPELPQRRHKGSVTPDVLVEVLGPRHAVSLVRTHGGRYLPTYRNLLQFLRKECIIRDWIRGVTTLATLQGKYKCSAGLVDRAVAEAKKRRRRETAERMVGVEGEPLIHEIRIRGGRG